jgi:hypothetical protein
MDAFQSQLSNHINSNYSTESVSQALQTTVETTITRVLQENRSGFTLHSNDNNNINNVSNISNNTTNEDEDSDRQESFPIGPIQSIWFRWFTGELSEYQSDVKYEMVKKSKAAGCIRFLLSRLRLVDIDPPTDRTSYQDSMAIFLSAKEEMLRVLPFKKGEAGAMKYIRLYAIIEAFKKQQVVVASQQQVVE